MLVGIVEGHGAIARIFHIGHVGNADALGIGGGFSRRGDPLVGGAVTDPGGAAAVEVNGGAVLGVKCAGVAFEGVITGSAVGIQRALPGTHDRLVNRDKKIAVLANEQLIDKFDPHRAIALGNNDGSQVISRGRIAGGVICSS